MEGKKPLCLHRGFESAHLPFALARRLMRNLHAVIGVTVGAVIHVIENGSYRSRVAFQSVGDDPQRLSFLPAHKPTKEPFRSAPVTSRLHQDVDDVAVLIDRPPQILLRTVNSNKDFIQMPVMAELALSSLQLASVIGPELLTPQPDRLM
jgi:hypothetical protein